jgi:hypothetical protein
VDDQEGALLVRRVVSFLAALAAGVVIGLLVAT